MFQLVMAEAIASAVPYFQFFCVQNLDDSPIITTFAAAMPCMAYR